MFNYTLYHEDAWADGDIAPLTLNLRTDGNKLSASFPVSTRQGAEWAPENLLPLLGIEPGFLGSSAHSLAPMPNELSSPYKTIKS